MIMASTLVLRGRNNDEEETFLIIGIDFGTSYAKCLTASRDGKN